MGEAVVHHDRLAAIEASAVELLAAIGNPPPPVSALALADAFGFAVKRGFPGIPTAVADALKSRLLADRWLIEVSPTLAGRLLHEAVAHELGYWVLAQFSLPPSEADADAMAAALMMPLVHSAPDAQAPLEALLDRHRFCTLRLIDRRIQSLAKAFSDASFG